MRGGSVPAHIWLVLGVAICGVSSAGAIFTHVDEIDPLLRASWRLQLTALILAPLAIWQLYQIDDEVKSKLWSVSTAKIILASGVFLALHFGFWVTSLDYTSLAHSLLFVTAHPLVILIGMFLFVRKPNRLELIGGIAAFTGAAISMLPRRLLPRHGVILDLLSPFLGGRRALASWLRSLFDEHNIA